MPVVEAMACGCPVITTKQGALGEMASDAAVFTFGHDEEELGHAMMTLRAAARKIDIIERGLRRAASVDWDSMARSFCDLLQRAVEERDDPRRQEFFREWSRLRTIQAQVDVT